MNESSPTHSHNSKEAIEMKESADGIWEQLRESAPKKAEAIIDGIEGFDTMSLPEQSAALKTELSALNDRADNNDRFVVEELARNIKEIELYKDISELETKISTLGGRINTQA